MNTSQYDAKTRKALKRLQRNPIVRAMAAKNRELIAGLEKTLTQRNQQIENLKKEGK